MKLPVTGSPITITAGTTYWIVFNGNASVPVYISLTDSKRKQERQERKKKIVSIVSLILCVSSSPFSEPVVSDLWAKIPTTTSWVSLTTPMAPINLFVYDTDRDSCFRVTHGDVINDL